MNETGLVRHGAALPSAADWSTTMEMAQVLLQSGMLPSHIKSVPAAVAIIQKGRELGISPMYSLSNIVCIQGKPTANAELMLALIYRDHGDNAVYFEEANNNRCVIGYKRRGWDSCKRFSFDMDDARKAGLLSNQTWQKYPGAMLRARCISAVARLAFPDSIGGMYSPDELGAAVTVDSEGVVNVQHVDTSTGEIREPAPPALPAASTTDLDGPISERTMKALHAAGRENGWEHDSIHAEAAERYAVDTLAGLSERQGRELGRFVRENVCALVGTVTLSDDDEAAATYDGDVPEGEEEQELELVQTAVGEISVPKRRTAKDAKEEIKDSISAIRR